MGVVISRPRVHDVTIQNNPQLLYITGDETTEGSIRITFDEFSEDNARFEARTDGVWNETGIEIAAATIFLGRELSISAAGEFLKTQDARIGTESLAPLIEFDDQGTRETGYFAQLDPLIVKQVIVSDDSSEITANEFQFTIATGLATRLTLGFYVKLGSTAPTSSVTMTGRRDSFSGSVFFQWTYPNSLFNQPNGTEIFIDFEQPLRFDTTATYFTFSSDDGSDMSLRAASVSATIPYYAIDYYPLDIDPIMTFGTLSHILTSGVNEDVVIDNNGDLVTSEVTVE